MHRQLQFFLCLLLLCVCGMATGIARENGIYAIDKYGPAFTPAPQAITLVSQNNDNTDYLLSFWWTPSPESSGGPHILLFNDQVFNLWSEGGGGPRVESSHEEMVHISDPKLVQQFADYFKITPFTRHHPGDQFTCKFIPKPDGYPLAGPFPVTLQITNYGNTPFSFPSRGLAYERPIQRAFGPFTFIAFYNKMESSVVGQFEELGSHWTVPVGVENLPPKEMATMHDWTLVTLPSKKTVVLADWKKVTLNTGESWTTEVDLSQYLKIQKFGTYEVRGVYHFQVIDPEIIKAKRGYWAVPWNILWDEYAAGEFEMKIHDDKGQ
jgi:hypothetical protein